MSKENLHMNNPLQGVGLKTVLEELVTYYGFDVLYAYLNMNCFKSNPSITACAKFLKKTDWAREKVELLYLYQYKNLPAVSSEQFNVAPRERIVPEHQKPGQPAILTIEDGERLQQKRRKNAASRNSYNSERQGSSRAYNDKRNTQRHKPDDYGSEPGHYKTADTKTNESRSSSSDDEPELTEPAPVFDPWATAKRRTER